MSVMHFTFSYRETSMEYSICKIQKSNIGVSKMQKHEWDLIFFKINGILKKPKTCMEVKTFLYVDGDSGSVLQEWGKMMAIFVWGIRNKQFLYCGSKRFHRGSKYKNWCMAVSWTCMGRSLRCKISRMGYRKWKKWGNSEMPKKNMRGYRKWKKVVWALKNDNILMIINIFNIWQRNFSRTKTFYDARTSFL